MKKSYLSPAVRVVCLNVERELLLSSGSVIGIPRGAKEAVFYDETDNEYDEQD